MKKLSVLVSALTLSLFACAAEDETSPSVENATVKGEETFTVTSVTLDDQGNATDVKEEKITRSQAEALTAARKAKHAARKDQAGNDATATVAKNVDSAATVVNDPSCINDEWSSWFWDQTNGWDWPAGVNLLCLRSDGALSAGFDLASVGWSGRTVSVWADAHYAGGLYPSAWSYCELPAEYGPCVTWEPWSPVNIPACGRYAIIPRWCTSIVH